MAKRHFRILIQTEEVVVRRSETTPTFTWCRECKGETRMMTVTQAALLCQVDHNAIRERIHRGELHVSQTPAGVILICMQSLGI